MVDFKNIYWPPSYLEIDSYLKGSDLAIEILLPDGEVVV